MSLFVILAVFCLLESTGKFFPSVIPNALQNYFAKDQFEQTKKQVVEYLGQNPYVKFKPHTLVRSQGYRGREDQFAYEWKTDSRGFKNLPEISQKQTVEIVALGNSFTEGMGVTTQQTWPSLLSEQGHTTYNLGVQGYAPSQCEGAFRLFGVPLEPNYVIIGYLGSTYDRERYFFDVQKAKREKKFTGGIQSSIESNAREIKHRTRWMTSAIYLWFRDLSFSFLRSKKSDLEIIKEDLKRYQAALHRVRIRRQKLKEINLSPKQWQETLKSFARIKNLANELGAKTLLVYFTHRGIIYFEKATGNALPQADLENIELKQLKEFCQEQEIVFLNPTQRLMDYVNQLPDSAPLSQYPYLEVDGHLSPVGHKLVAQEILDYLQK